MPWSTSSSRGRSCRCSTAGTVGYGSERRGAGPASGGPADLSRRGQIREVDPGLRKIARGDHRLAQFLMPEWDTCPADYAAIPVFSCRWALGISVAHHEETGIDSGPSRREPLGGPACARAGRYDAVRTKLLEAERRVRR